MDGENKEIFRFYWTWKLVGSTRLGGDGIKFAILFLPITFFYNILTQCPFSSVNSILSGGKREEFYG